VPQGSLELKVDGKVHLLSAGDYFHFNSSLPHAYANPDKMVAHVIWVNSPPT
jgi:quercetin dioxygenase-like cupin family protein